MDNLLHHVRTVYPAITSTRITCLVPCCIVRFNKMVDLLFKKPGQGLIFRCKVALAHDPAGPLSFGIEDQQAPAAIVPADLRAGQVDRAVPFFRSPVVPEKRAGFGTFKKNTLVTKESNLVRVNGHLCFFTGILVVYQEPVIPVVFPDGMD